MSFTRNPNLSAEPLSISTAVTNFKNDEALIGERPRWWWSGLQPKYGQCPGVGEDKKIRSLPMLNLSTCTRQQVFDYFANGWALTEVLFESLQGEEAFRCPPYHQLRHPIIFYYGHPACLFVNKLRIAGLLDSPINPYFEQIFETGVDEMSWDDMSKNEMDWPSVREINAYRRTVFQLVKNLIETHPDLADGHPPITWEHPLWALFMGFEHERIHLETSSVLLRELPLRFLKRPAAWPDIFSSIDAEKFPANRLIPIDGSTVKIGKPTDWPSYGWDNEYGQRTAEVRPFEISTFMVSNGEFLEFVRDGGYRETQYWTQQGWKWREFRNSKWPSFWIATGPAGNHQYKLRTIFDVVDLPFNWPVCVNFHEAKAYLAWRSKRDGKPYRLPTEAEHGWLRHDREAAQIDLAIDPVMIYSGEGLAKDKLANFNFAFSSEYAVDQSKTNRFGIHDLTGNLWDWCEDDFHPLESFRVHSLYDDFSTPCFDGEHSMMLGGSFASSGDEASIWSRFHFRPHFFQHAGFHIVAPGKGESSSGAILINEKNRDHAKYETTTLLGQYILLHYGYGANELIPSTFIHATEMTSFPQRCAETLINWAQKAGAQFDSAIDVGCAVGGASFALSRNYSKVIGVDISSNFIQVAKEFQEKGERTFDVLMEGEITKRHIATVPPDIDRQRTTFRRADACGLPAEYAHFDAVLAANLLCRLPSPKAFLGRLAGPRGLLKPGGVVMLASPYSWFPQFTTKSAWLGGFIENDSPVWSFDRLKKLMEEDFELLHREDLPLWIREHARKFEYIITDVTIWRRRN